MASRHTRSRSRDRDRSSGRRDSTQDNAPRSRSTSPESQEDLMTEWHRTKNRCAVCAHRVIGRGDTTLCADGYVPANFYGAEPPLLYFCGHCLHFKYYQCTRFADIGRQLHPPPSNWRRLVNPDPPGARSQSPSAEPPPRGAGTGRKVNDDDESEYYE